MSNALKDIRWRHRYENFDRAFQLLSAAVTKYELLDDLSREGLIQRFEYTFELAWKTLKDYLESRNVDAKFPRDVIKEAFRYELIVDGDVWLDMLEKRNRLAYTYNENNFKEALNSVVYHYFEALKELHAFFGKDLRH